MNRQWVILLSTALTVMACKSTCSKPADVAEVVSSLAQSVFARKGEVNRCVMVHFTKGMVESDGIDQVVVIDPNATDENVLFGFSMWLKAQSWCIVAVVEGDNNTLEAAIKLVQPVSRKLVISLGSVTQENIVDRISLVNTRIVWLEQTSFNQVYLSVKCPTVVPKPWPVQRRINLWKSLEGKFSVTDPGVITCKNPMFGQHLIMTHYGEPNQIIFSPDTGLPVGGRMFNLFQMLSKEFEFTFEPAFVQLAVYHPENDSYTGGSFAWFNAGMAFAVAGSVVEDFHYATDLSSPYAQNYNIFISRKPIPIDTYDNLILPFSPGVWACSVAAMIATGIMMLIAYNVYLANSESKHLVKTESSPINIVLYAIVKITEPDPLPWFMHWSTGKFLVFKWIILSTFLIMFYTSNLRAHLINRDLEKPLDMLQDVVDNGQTPYIYKDFNVFTTAYQESIGQADSVHYKIAKLAEKTGGYFEITYQNAAEVFEHIGKALAEDRAAYLVMKSTVSLLYLSNREYFRRHMLYEGKESGYSFYECVAMKKYSPATPLVSKVIVRATEAGLSAKYLNDFVPMEQSVKMDESYQPIEPLKLRTFSLALMFYIFGMLTALITYLTENYGKSNTSKGSKNHIGKKAWPRKDYTTKEIFLTI